MAYVVTRIHSIRMCTTCSLLYEVSVQGILVQRGYSPEEEGPLCRGGESLSETLPRRSMGPETETPLEGTWDQAARHEITSYRDPLPHLWTE